MIHPTDYTEEEQAAQRCRAEARREEEALERYNLEQEERSQAERAAWDQEMDRQAEEDNARQTDEDRFLS